MKKSWNNYCCRAPMNPWVTSPRRLWIAFLTCAIFLTSLVNAQQPQLLSHEVNPDQSITFRYYSPTAKKVTLGLDYEITPIPMEKGSDGVWTFKTKPLQPCVHMYAFLVDGIRLQDPYNPISESTYYFIGSLIKVEGPQPQLWDVTDVPHGDLHYHLYHSSEMANLPKGMEDYYVYTPPGYEKQGNAPYPVLYLLHGWSGKADAWVASGQANFILDNLIAQKRISPMVVVMPQCYGDLDFVTHGFGVWSDPSAVTNNIKHFSSALLKEIIPQIQADYHVSSDRKDRAIAGLSMGGGESLDIGLNNPDLFGYVGGFSSAPARSDVYGDVFPKIGAPGTANPQLIWIACGTSDRLLPQNQSLIAWLKSKGVNLTAVETPGIHNWEVWRDNLINFTPLLFK